MATASLRDHSSSTFNSIPIAKIAMNGNAYAARSLTACNTTTQTTAEAPG